jgi:hypothetical protein
LCNKDKRRKKKYSYASEILKLLNEDYLHLLSLRKGKKEYLSVLLGTIPILYIYLSVLLGTIPILYIYLSVLLGTIPILYLYYIYNRDHPYSIYI